MQPEPPLAGVATAPAPGPIERLLRFGRAGVEATLTPLRFLQRWETEPARYPDPGALLALNAALVALVTWLANEFLQGAGGEAAFAAAAGTSAWARRIAGGFGAIMPAALVYAQVLSTWLAGRLLAGATGWPPARRIAAFLSAVYLPVTVASLLVVFGWPRTTGAVAAASMAVDLVYGTLGFQAVFGLRPGRAAAAALVTLVATLLFQLAFFSVASFATGLAAAGLP